MNSVGRTVAKNVSILFASQFITWAFAIALAVFLPRYLGPTEIGRFQLAVSIWTIIGIFVTFGVDTYLVKEIARAPEKMTELFGTVLLLRTVLMMIGFVLVGAYCYFLRFPPSTIILIVLIGVANIFSQFSGITAACLAGVERFEYISLSDILSKAFLTVLTIVLLLMGYRAVMAAVMVIGSAVIYLAIQFLALRRLHPLPLSIQWNQARQILHSGLPYLVNTGIRTAYVQIDILIISWVATETIIGWYSAASRLFSTLLFIPTVLMTAIFPLMSRYHSTAPDELPALIRKNFDLMLLFGVPIGLGVFLIANPTVRILYGADFIQSGPVLAVMGFVLIVTYQNILLGQYLISTDRQNTLTWIMAVATLATIPLDFYLIPLCERLYQNGAIGGALSFLITESAMTLIEVWLLPKGTLGKSTIWMVARVGLAGLVMTAVAWPFRENFLAVPILVGAVTYLAMVWALRIIPKDDWLLIKSLLQSAIAKFRKPGSSPTKAGEPL